MSDSWCDEEDRMGVLLRQVSKQQNMKTTEDYGTSWRRPSSFCNLCASVQFSKRAQLWTAPFHLEAPLTEKRYDVLWVAVRMPTDTAQPTDPTGVHQSRRLLCGALRGPSHLAVRAELLVSKVGGPSANSVSKPWWRRSHPERRKQPSRRNITQKVL